VIVVGITVLLSVSILAGNRSAIRPRSCFEADYVYAENRGDKTGFAVFERRESRLLDWIAVAVLTRGTPPLYKIHGDRKWKWTETASTTVLALSPRRAVSSLGGGFPTSQPAGEIHSLQHTSLPCHRPWRRSWCSCWASALLRLAATLSLSPLLTLFGQQPAEAAAPGDPQGPRLEEWLVDLGPRSYEVPAGNSRTTPRESWAIYCVHLCSEHHPQRGVLPPEWHPPTARMFYFYFSASAGSRGFRRRTWNWRWCCARRALSVLWMTGGPGCSSGVALFFENGPFTINNENKTLSWNPYGWDLVRPSGRRESPSPFCNGGKHSFQSTAQAASCIFKPTSTSSKACLCVPTPSCVC